MKFNTPTNTKTVNRAGGEAYAKSPKLTFASLLLTSFVKDQYYRSEKGTLKEVAKLFDELSDKKFAAKAAIYARTEFGMRSISHVVAANVASKVKGETWTKNFFDKVVYRPDDMTEILAYYYALGNKNEPNALKKGFAKALSRFDEYQLAKYKKDGATVSLIDVANLVHPRNTEAISKLINGTLPTPKTWETELTKAGKAEDVDEAKNQAWASLIREKKLGYFALLRNLRNIVEQAPEVLDEALEMLVDENLIRKSLVLPFRYLTAIEEMEKLSGPASRKVIQSLNTALDVATVNVPKLEGDTLVAIDQSGSMESQQTDIASLFGAILAKTNNADVMTFSNDARYISLNPTDSTLTLTKQIKANYEGGGTNYHAIFETANRAYDRIITLSDEQAWVGYNTPGKTFNEYKKRTGANSRIYSIDLAGYGTSQFPEQDIYCLAGFSEKIFDIMKLLEEDRNALVNKIEGVSL